MGVIRTAIQAVSHATKSVESVGRKWRIVLNIFDGYLKKRVVEIWGFEGSRVDTENR